MMAKIEVKTRKESFASTGFLLFQLELGEYEEYIIRNVTLTNKIKIGKSPRVPSPTDNRDFPKDPFLLLRPC